MLNQLRKPIKKLLIATGNKGKLVEIAKLLQQIEIQAIGSFDYNLPEPEEDGKNFMENSIIKAKYYGDKTGFVTLSDDSGLCIELLNTMPGIYSARWAIDNISNQKDFTLAFKRIKEELIKKGIDLQQTKIKAYFICSLSIYNPRIKTTHSFEGRVDGRVTFPARGQNGFGYDPIFIPGGYNQTFAEMESKLKDNISHRNKAFENLTAWLYENPSFID